MRNPFLSAASLLGVQHFTGRDDQAFALLLDVLADAYELNPTEWRYDDPVSETLTRLAQYRERHFWPIERIMQRYAGRAMYGEAVR